MSKITGVTILAICAAVAVPMTVSSPTDAQTLPTLDVSPTEAQAGSTVTAAWSGIPNPTSTDWIGLFEPGAPNTAFLDWMYVSCSKTPGAAAAAGSCSLVIPGTLAPGPYELRLLANNGLMAATLNNTASGLWTHGTSATFDHEVLAGANRYLLVITGSFDPVAVVAPSSVTYGGVNLIRLHGVEDDTNRTEIWGWDPGQGEVPVGIASVVVTWPGGGQEDIFPSAVSFLGVDWAGAPVGGFTSEIDAIDPGPQPSIDVTSGSADDLVLDALNSDDPDALTPGVGQTYVFSPSDTPTMSISSKPGIAGPVTMEWTDLSNSVQYLHLGFTVRASQAVATSLAAKALTVTGQVPVDPRMSISPSSGEFVTSQQFDLMVALETNGASVVNWHILFDGMDVTELAFACFGGGEGVIQGRRLLRCPGLTGALIGPGEHILSVRAELTDGSTPSASATWRIIPNREP